jgi:hypothetical protein
LAYVRNASNHYASLSSEEKSVELQISVIRVDASSSLIIGNVIEISI